MIGLVQGWAAIVMGLLAGSVPWFTMMVVHKKSRILQHVDDTLAVFHTHAVAGILGGLMTGLLADPILCSYFRPGVKSGGSFYGGQGKDQIGRQLVGALFIIGWNVVTTSLICLAINLVVPLRMSVEELSTGDDAAHGEEAYALWGDGEKFNDNRFNVTSSNIPMSNLQDAEHGIIATHYNLPKESLTTSSTVHI